MRSMCHRVVYCDGGSRECRELNRHVTNMKIEPENEKTWIRRQNTGEHGLRDTKNGWSYLFSI